MAWTNLSYAYGSVLTSSKMTQLYNNLYALADKDSGAPVLRDGYIRPTMIDSYSVGSAYLAGIDVNTATIPSGIGEAYRNKVTEWIAAAAGTVRIGMRSIGIDTNNIGNFKVYVNSVQVDSGHACGSFASSGTLYESDATVAIGDRIEVCVYNTHPAVFGAVLFHRVWATVNSQHFPLVKNPMSLIESGTTYANSYNYLTWG